MALEPAGVSLEAQGFNEYIKKLDAIEKKNRRVFDQQFKGTGKSFAEVTKAAKQYEDELRRVEKESKKTSIATKGIGIAAGAAASAGILAVTALAGSLVNLGKTAARVFAGIVKEGVAINRQFELSEKVFTNVFGDPNLGKATVDFLNETADRLRLNRTEAAQFAQTILPKSGGLDQFTELLRLTDIQADSTGQSLGELEFSIREALSGDFVSLKDRFDLGTEQINRIKELTPELGRAGALIEVVGDEFERLGKTDISGTLSTNIKDIQSRFTSLQATLGKPSFDQLRIQSDAFLGALDRNEEGLERTAIALGEVTANAIELISTELIEFIDGLDFKSIEQGIDFVNRFIEELRTLTSVTKTAFDTGIIQTAFGIITGNVNQTVAGFTKLKEADFGQAFEDISNAVNKADERQAAYKKRVDEAANSQSNFNSENEKAINAFLEQSAASDKAAQSIKSYEVILKQAENLQLSFARSAEDAALKLSRANEDIARKQGRQVNKLQEKQKKDRSKILDDQIKELERFDVESKKEIANAEKEIEKERAKVAENRVD